MKMLIATIVILFLIPLEAQGKTCTIGQPCGNTCISVEDVCHINSSNSTPTEWDATSKAGLEIGKALYPDGQNRILSYIGLGYYLLSGGGSAILGNFALMPAIKPGKAYAFLQVGMGSWDGHFVTTGSIGMHFKLFSLWGSHQSSFLRIELFASGLADGINAEPAGLSAAIGLAF